MKEKIWTLKELRNKNYAQIKGLLENEVLRHAHLIEAAKEMIIDDENGKEYKYLNMFTKFNITPLPTLFSSNNLRGFKTNIDLKMLDIEANDYISKIPSFMSKDGWPLFHIVLNDERKKIIELKKELAEARMAGWEYKNYYEREKLYGKENADSNLKKDNLILKSVNRDLEAKNKHLNEVIDGLLELNASMAAK